MLVVTQCHSPSTMSWGHAVIGRAVTTLLCHSKPLCNGAGRTDVALQAGQSSHRVTVSFRPAPPENPNRSPLKSTPLPTLPQEETPARLPSSMPGIQAVVRVWCLCGSCQSTRQKAGRRGRLESQTANVTLQTTGSWC